MRSQKEQQVSGMSKQYEDQLRRRDKEVRAYVRVYVCDLDWSTPVNIVFGV